MQPDMLYRKRGRRYIPVDREFTGFPAEGIWFVLGGSMRRFMRIGDVPSIMNAAAFERHRDAICSAIVRVQNWTMRSPNDLASEIIQAVAEAEEMGGRREF